MSKKSLQTDKEENLIFNDMKSKNLKLVIAFILVMIASCDEPETIVTDIIHPDGSITRKIEMKNTKNEFKPSELQVPFDSTWKVRDSLEIHNTKDTVWVKRAEKLYRNMDELNNTYASDSSYNRNAKRRTELRKRFLWFNTQYRFAEIIEKHLSFGYPVSQFLNKEETDFFYSPDEINSKKEQGPDSLKIKALKDTVSKKTDRWVVKCLVAGWIDEFSKLTGGKGDNEISFENLKKREDEFVHTANFLDNKFDSLWKAGVVLKDLIGESNAVRFKTEADSAMNLVTKSLFMDFRDYTQRIVMPGTIIGTNGFLDSTKVLFWPVKSDYFLTQPYEMYAESKVSNTWAWVISGVFLLFVLAGIIFRTIKKG